MRMCGKAFWEYQALQPSEGVEGEKGVAMVDGQYERVVGDWTFIAPGTLKHHRTHPTTYQVFQVLPQYKW